MCANPRFVKRKKKIGGAGRRGEEGGEGREERVMVGRQVYGYGR